MLVFYAASSPIVQDRVRLPSALCTRLKLLSSDGQVDASKSIKRMMSLIVNNPPRTLLLTKTRHFVESLALLP